MVDFLIFFLSLVGAFIVGFGLKIILCFGFSMNDLLTSIIATTCIIPIPVLTIYYLANAR